jgi:glyoxylase-like metal-dependent hydrolase (beta-lactamase superfamily II)
VRAIALHADVLVASSAVLQVNCVIVRGSVARGDAGGGDADGHGSPAAGRDAEMENPVRVIEPGGETVSGAEVFVIDSPVLPEELETLPALLDQARFPTPNGLLATHGDWDHLLGRLAFPGVALGVAESTAERLRASPGEAQRELRTFDKDLLIERPRPLALGSVQALPVPGRCALGDHELELHPAEGHTPDGMAIVIPWARVLVAGDYLSTVEPPTLNDGGDRDAYLATLARLRPLVASAEHIVPGHGPVMDSQRAIGVLEENIAVLTSR